MHKFDALDFTAGCAESEIIRHAPFNVHILDYYEDDSRGLVGLTPQLIAEHGSVVLNIDVDEDHDSPAARIHLRELHKMLQPLFAHMQLFENNDYAQLYGYVGSMKAALDVLVGNNVITSEEAKTLLAFAEAKPDFPRTTAHSIASALPKPTGME